MSKLRGIQKLVLTILREDKTYNKPFTSRADIIVRLGKLSITSEFARHYAGDDVPILMHKVDQALYQLSKNKKIVRVDIGKWTLPSMPEITPREKHQTKICKGLVKKGNDLYCPVRRSYISDPSHQCALMIGTNVSKKEWHFIGMKPCHMTSKPEPLLVEYMRDKYLQKEALLNIEHGTWKQKFETSRKLSREETEFLKQQVRVKSPRTHILRNP